MFTKVFLHLTFDKGSCIWLEWALQIVFMIITIMIFLFVTFNAFLNFMSTFLLLWSMVLSLRVFAITQCDTAVLWATYISTRSTLTPHGSVASSKLVCTHTHTHAHTHTRARAACAVRHHWQRRRLWGAYGLRVCMSFCSPVFVNKMHRKVVISMKCSEWMAIGTRKTWVTYLLGMIRIPIRIIIIIIRYRLVRITMLVVAFPMRKF